MSKIRSIVAAQSSVGEPEHRGDERSEAARSGGSPTFEPDVVPVVPDSEVPARHARRRQHEKLERQLDGGLRGPHPHRLDRLGHVPVGKRLPVRHDVVLRTEHRQHPVTPVVVPHVQGDGPLQHRADALADGAGRLRLDVPNRREDVQYVGRVDLGHGPVADAWEGVAFHAPPPVLRVPPAAPAAALLFEHALGGLGEGGNALRAAFLGEKIAPGPRQHAVGEGQLAGFGERRQSRRHPVPRRRTARGLGSSRGRWPARSGHRPGAGAPAGTGGSRRGRGRAERARSPRVTPRCARDRRRRRQ